MASTDNIRIVKNTGILYIRMLILMFLGFYTSRIVLNSLGVVDYGVYNVVGGIVSVFSILTTAMSGTTQRYITIALGENDIDKLKEVFSVSLTIHLTISIILFICIEILGLYFMYNHAVIPEDRLTAAFWVFQISTITAILTIINVPFNGTIIAHEKMSAFAFFSLIDVVVKLSICFILPYTSFDKLIVYASLLFISSIINFTSIQIYCIRKFIETRYKLSWDKSIFKSMLGMTSWSLIDKIAYIGFAQGVTLVTNIFFGPAINAASGIASQGSNVISQFTQNFQIAVNPQITKSYANGDLSNMHKLIIRSAKFSCFLLLYLIIPAFFEAETLLKLWLGNVPDHTVLYFKLSLIMTLINAVINPLQISNMACGKVRNYLLTRNLILLLVLPTTYLIYKIGGIPESSVIVNILTFTIAMIAGAKILQTQIQLKFSLFLHEIVLNIIAITILSCIIPLLIHISIDNEIMRLISTILSSVISTSLFVYIIGLNNEERQFISERIKNNIKRIF
jgi:O-antigen/teichoic acid export membrane protein